VPATAKILSQEALLDAPYAASSLAEAAHFEPQEGVYTVTNTYKLTKVLKLDDHLDRMEASARLAGMSLHLDRTRLRRALRQMILAANYGDVRFRITAPKDTPDHLILTIEPYTPPSEELVQTGVRVMTVPNSARKDASAKTTDWMHEREAIERAIPPGTYTAILLDSEQQLLEGVNSNFYAILRGELRTAGSGVLAGIAQQIVFEVVGDVVPVRKDAVRMPDIPNLSEAFITSSSRGIIPVVQIDEYMIGNGQPGAITQQLRARYDAWAHAHLEEL
jgi:branched-chain amino acid aminotransferase